MRRFVDTNALYDYLLGFVNVEKGQKTVFKLDRMRALCALLGEPQRSYKVIHVAGSKGKGSVSAMISRLLEAGGMRVGLYTSPHMLRWKERITLAGDDLPEDLLLAAAQEVLPFIEGKSPGDFPGDELPTYFELTTLIAFCAFRQAGCDWAVVETGLGGRLDSTNVVDSVASVITPIELEHTEWLGDTIPLIAAEKAGIIKPGKPCFISRQKLEALSVIERTAHERSSLLREMSLCTELVESSITTAGTRARIIFSEDSPLASRYSSGLEVATPMIGAIQADNMALALLATGETDVDLDLRLAAVGLAKAFLPGRFQVIALEPPIVLDGAHTPDSIGLALRSFETLFPGPAALLFACAEDKNHEQMAAILGPRFERITLTRPGNFKKADLPAVERSFASAGAGFHSIADHEPAIDGAIAEARALGLPLLVTGSFYLCAEVLAQRSR